MLHVEMPNSALSHVLFHLRKSPGTSVSPVTPTLLYLWVVQHWTPCVIMDETVCMEAQTLSPFPVVLKQSPHATPLKHKGAHVWVLGLRAPVLHSSSGSLPLC